MQAFRERLTSDSLVDAWRTTHGKKLADSFTWSTVSGESRDRVVLPPPARVSATACVSIAGEHGYTAEVVKRASCTCGIREPSLLARIWGSQCTCPVAEWVSYAPRVVPAPVIHSSAGGDE